MLQKIRWFFLLVGGTIVLLLLLWNSSAVTVSFPFFAERQLPLSILLLATFAIGSAFGAIVTGWTLHRRHKAVAKAEATKKRQKTSNPPTASATPSTVSH